FCEFPRPVPMLAARPRRAWIFYAVLPPVFAFLLLARWPGSSTAWMLVSSFVFIFTVGSGFFVLGVLVRMWRSTPALAAQYRDLVIAVGLGLVLPSVWHMLRMVLGFWQQKWIVHLNTVPILIF